MGDHRHPAPPDAGQANKKASRSLASWGVLLVGFGTASLLPTVLSAQATGASHTRQLEEGAERPTASLADLSWLVGSWEGDAFGGRAEEVWMPASGGSMAGTFKLIVNDAATMYEFFTIVPDGESLTLRLKHFDRDLVGWEERDEYVEFPLVRLEKDAVYFAGLTYRRIGEADLVAYVSVSQGGSVFEETIRFRTSEE